MANPVRGRLMVGRLTLDQVVKVRVLAPQPSRADDPDELKPLRGRRAKGSQELCGLGAQRPPKACLLHGSPGPSARRVRIVLVVSLHFKLMTRLWTDAESAYQTRLLEALPASDSSTRLLDLGCDDGAWTEELRGRLGVSVRDVHALEIVPARAELARARGFDARTGDLDDRWPFEGDSFDLVHANQVIEHVRRLDHFVQEISRVLRPRGRALVCTENLASWHNVAALALGYQPFSLTNISTRRPIGNPFASHADESSPVESLHHVHVLSLTALRDIFVAHGFAIEDAWGTGYHPLPGRLASWMAARDPRHAHFVGIVARLWRGSSTTASNADGHETASYKLLAVAAAAYV